MTLADLAADICARAEGRARFVVAIAGPPGAGKSTFAEALLGAVEAVLPGEAAVVPMDGYHLDDAILVERGLRPRKGAPWTFDVDGFAAALARIRRGGREVFVPVFDRDLELARAAARAITPAHRVVLVEGNYLLLDQAPWTDLAPLFDRTLFLKVDPAEIERRLLARWDGYGLADAALREKMQGNDLPNAELVNGCRRPADVEWANG